MYLSQWDDHARQLIARIVQLRCCHITLQLTFLPFQPGEIRFRLVLELKQQRRSSEPHIVCKKNNERAGKSGITLKNHNGIDPWSPMARQRTVLYPNIHYREELRVEDQVGAKDAGGQTVNRVPCNNMSMGDWSVVLVTPHRIPDSFHTTDGQAAENR
jgi:hypothetical protein